MSGTLTLTRDGGVLHVLLDRPGTLNAISVEMLDELAATFASVEEDPEVRAVLLSGAGRVFCAGADLQDVRGLMADAHHYRGFLDHWHEVFAAIERCSVPTFAAVHGVALAGGLELVQVCDVVVVAESARLGDQHARFGLFPGGGATQRLPRLIGPRRATWLMLTAEWISAETAVDWGLATAVVPDAELLDRAREMAARQAAMSPAASAAIKCAVRQGAALPLDAALELERGMATEHMAGPDAATGLASFADGTPPHFAHRRTPARSAGPST